MLELSVRPMTEDEFDQWRATAVRKFAEEQIAAGVWSSAEALDLASASNAELLPAGFATPGMVFLTAVGPDGSRVGVAWIGLVHPRGTADCAFLYEIEIEETRRGAGLGRALLTEAEKTVRAHGLAGLELNVLGDNTRAIHLYRSAGYTVTTQRMRKNLPH